MRRLACYLLLCQCVAVVGLEVGAYKLDVGIHVCRNFKLGNLAVMPLLAQTGNKGNVFQKAVSQ